MSRLLPDRTYREVMDELADSGGLVGDAEGLRRRLAAARYLFFRGLLPAGQISPAIRHVVRKQKNVRVDLAEVTGFDLDRRPVFRRGFVERTGSGVEVAQCRANVGRARFQADRVSR